MLPPAMNGQEGVITWLYIDFYFFLYFIQPFAAFMSLVLVVDLAVGWAGDRCRSCLQRAHGLNFEQLLGWLCQPSLYRKTIMASFVLAAGFVASLRHLATSTECPQENQEAAEGSKDSYIIGRFDKASQWCSFLAGSDRSCPQSLRAA
jgi:hypothetical protein